MQETCKFPFGCFRKNCVCLACVFLLFFLLCPQPGILGKDIFNQGFSAIQSISVSNNSAVLYSVTELPSAQNVPVMGITVRDVSTLYNVSLMTIKATGTMDEPTGISSVYLYEDGNEIFETSDAAVAGPVFFAENDGTVTFTVPPPDSLQGERNFTIAVNLSGTPALGETMSFEITSKENIAYTSSLSIFECKVIGTFPIKSLEKTISDTGTLIVDGSGYTKYVSQYASNQCSINMWFQNTSVEPLFINSFILHCAGSVNENEAVEQGSIRVYDSTGKDLYGYGMSMAENDGSVTFTEPLPIIPVNYTEKVKITFTLDDSFEDDDWTTFYINLSEIKVTGVNSGKDAYKTGLAKVSARFEVYVPPDDDDDDYGFFSDDDGSPGPLCFCFVRKLR